MHIHVYANETQFATTTTPPSPRHTHTHTQISLTEFIRLYLFKNSNKLLLLASSENRTAIRCLIIPFAENNLLPCRQTCVAIKASIHTRVIRISSQRPRQAFFLDPPRHARGRKVSDEPLEIIESAIANNWQSLCASHAKSIIGTLRLQERRRSQSYWFDQQQSGVAVLFVLDLFLMGVYTILSILSFNMRFVPCRKSFQIRKSRHKSVWDFK